MSDTIINRIRAQMGTMTGAVDVPPAHEPAMLVIGCVDARIDPLADLGLSRGEALMLRCIAALVPPFSHAGSAPIAAAVELALSKNVQNIVVMGHTDCGGIAACVANAPSQATACLHNYLSPLTDLRDQVHAKGGTPAEQIVELEKAAIRQGVENLRSYPMLARPLQEKRIALHGWLIHTASSHIWEMDSQSGDFSSMR